MTVNFKDPLNSDLTNDAYVSKIADDIKSGKLTLAKALEGTTVISVQKAIIQLFENQGTSEDDVNAKIYANENYISNGDSQKTGIEKLDAQAKQASDELVAFSNLIGEADGIAPLDENKLIPLENLPNGMVTLRGTWDASTNLTSDGIELADSTAAFFDGPILGVTGNVQITSIETGTDGNGITLIGNGIADLDAIVLDWNTNNPLYPIVLNSANGADIPDDLETIILGIDDGATFDSPVLGVTGNVILNALVLGVIGNNILLTGDGIKDLDTLVSDWNLANSENQISLDTLGTEIPDNLEAMQLSGGVSRSGTETGREGYKYDVTVAGTVDLGSGPETYEINDAVLLNTYGVWQKRDFTDAVNSVFGRLGAITAENNDYNADQITETDTRKFAINHNRDSSVDPTINDDSSTPNFYSIGSKWFNKITEVEYILKDSTVGAAVWVTAVDEILIPTVSVFNNTQTGTFPLEVTTDNLTVSFWLQFNPSDTSQEIFILDENGIPFTLWWTPNANVLSFNWAETVIDFVAIDADWHHYTCVYNSIVGELDLFVDGERMGREPIVGAAAFTSGMTFRIAGYNGTDSGWFINGKLANFEIWTEALDFTDARSLYQAGYYQNPKSLVSKTLLNHFLMGDNKQDTISFLKDNEGISDINWVDTVLAPSSVTFDTIDIPIKEVALIQPKEIGFIPTSTYFEQGNAGHALASFPVTTDTVSFSTWVQLDVADTSQGIFVVDIAGIELQMLWQSGGVATYYGGSPTLPTVNVGAPDGKWHHLVGVYQKVNPLVPLEGLVEMFFDGTFIGNRAILVPASIAAGMEVQLGNAENSLTNWGLEGRMSNFEIWNDVLNVDDALALYNAGYTQDPESIIPKILVTHYLMGANPLDSAEILKDNKGVEDAVWRASRISLNSANLPLPTPESFIPATVADIDAKVDNTKPITSLGLAGSELQSDVNTNTNKLAGHADTDTLPEGSNNFYTQVDTKVNLDALPRKEGKFYYASDENKAYADDGTTLNEIGGGAAGANVTLSNLTSPTSFNADLWPDQDNFRNVGTTNLKWLRGYFKALVQVGQSTADNVGLQEGFNTPSGVLSNGIRSLSIVKILSFFTTDRTGSVDSQKISIETGNTVNGNSGDIEIRTGVPSGGGARGSIVLKNDVDKTLLEVQPTGAVDLAIATTKYVDDIKTQRNEEIFILDATDISNGYIDLLTEAYQSTELIWKDDNSGNKFRGDDFSTELNGNVTRINLLAPFTATLGDKVAINYESAEFFPVSFRSAVWTPNSTNLYSSTLLGTSTQIAFSAWIYLPSDSVGAQEICVIGASIPTNGFSLVHNGVDSVELQIFTKSVLLSGITFNDSWYHVGFIFNGNLTSEYTTEGYGKCFVNGVSSAVVSGGGSDQPDILNQSGFTLGAGSGLGFFDGYFSNAEIFKDAGVTQADMASLYAAGYYIDPFTVIGKNAEARYLFGDLGVGDTSTLITDQTVNGHDLTVGGTPLTFSNIVP